jgi:sodium/potassium-transporting ATPase subunit alpha
VLVQGGWTWGQELVATSSLYRSATGATLAAIIAMQVGNVLGRRRERAWGLDAGLLRNRLMLGGIALEVAFSWALLYVPAVQRMMGTGPVDGWVYALAWMGAPVIFGMDGVRKWVGRGGGRRRR